MVLFGIVLVKKTKSSVLESIPVLRRLPYTFLAYLLNSLKYQNTKQVYLGIHTRELQTLLCPASLRYVEALCHPFAAVIELHVYP